MGQKASFQQVEWTQIKEQVEAANPILHNIINRLSPDGRLSLYLGDYPFGHTMVQRGRFMLPLENGESVSIDSPDCPKQWREALSYNIQAEPVGLVLKNSIEIYMTHEVTGVPITLATATTGAITSTSRINSKSKPYHPSFLWNQSAGAHSLFMLPKISQSRRFTRMQRKLGFNTDMPTSHLDHSELFRQMGNHDSVGRWRTKLLFFGKEWFERLDDPALIELKCFFLEQFRSKFDALGNIFMWDMIIALILRRRDIRPSLLVKNTIKHLLMLAVGMLPGLAPVTDSRLGPIEAIQRFILEEYQLQEYVPTIIGPAYFDLYREDSQPVYYSLAHPSLLEDAPRKKDNTSLLTEAFETAGLLEKVLDDIIHADFNISETPLYDIPSLAELDVFHPKAESYSRVSDSALLVEEDARFRHSLHPTDNQALASHSSFLKGCFRIRRR